MKRGLVLSLCAAAVVAMTAPAFAAVSASLNLRYTDPNTPSAGGTWELLAKAGQNGLAGIDAQIGGATGVTGVNTGNIVPTNTGGSINGAFNNTSSVFVFQPQGAGVEVTAGDDLVTPGIITGVGLGSGAGNIAKDDLYPNAPNAYDNSALLGSGTFGATRPTLAIEGANEFSGTTAVLATLGAAVVRGDSVADGLRPGDANRDGVVSGLDFSILSSNFNQAGTTWNQGNFNSATGTNGLDFSILSSNFNMTSTPPASGASIGAVPEPSSLVLFGLGLLGLGLRKRS